VTEWRNRERYGYAGDYWRQPDDRVLSRTHVRWRYLRVRAALIGEAAGAAAVATADPHSR